MLAVDAKFKINQSDCYKHTLVVICSTHILLSGQHFVAPKFCTVNHIASSVIHLTYCSLTYSVIICEAAVREEKHAEKQLKRLYGFM